MPERRRGSGGSRQPDLFARSKQPKISLPDNHPMVVLTDTVDWTEMEMRAAKIREKKLKNAAGRPPHLRATLGALTLIALRRLPYREVEEQIRHHQVPEVRIQSSGRPLGHDDGHVRPARRTWPEPHQAGPGCRGEQRDRSGNVVRKARESLPSRPRQHSNPPAVAAVPASLGDPVA